MRRLRYLKRDFKNNWDLYLLAIPLIAYYVIFCYGPMYGLKIAFMDYNPWKGMAGSAYAGLKHFRNFLSLSTSRQYIVNTLRISLTSLVLSYPLPILLALMLNAVRSTAARRIFQSISYLPHFLSWIVIASLVRSMFSTSTGAVNQVIKNLGMEPINFLGSGKYFRGVLVLSDCWKEIGWGSIIYLAALMGVDAQLYEAATVDGASPFRQLISITLPSIAPTIITMLILRVGGILSAGQDQVYAMYNELVYSVADILDTYALRVGLNNLKYSMSTAVSLFKSAIGLVMILVTNKISKMVDENNGIL